MHPEKIGPYIIDRKIGSGGMGNVYLGIHDQTEQQVAVKVLPASMAREEGFVLRFSREIKALRQLTSPYIVRLYEDGQSDDGSYYYSMEYVDGETLTSMVMRRKRIPWQEVIDISLDIAAALKSAHDSGIVHRDLKPSNLMISKGGDVKLTDFGVAHMFASTRLTRTGGVVGTAEYMSPEQARGKRATKHSDLYSLGAVMYVMLTGRPPFTGKMANDILHQHQFSQFDKPSHYVPELPRLLEQFVCTLLEKKPEKRFPDALVVIRKLENLRAQIEYAQRTEEDAPTAGGSTSPPMADHTAGMASDRTQGGDGRHDGPGHATMVRDAVRLDIEKSLQKSPIAQFFDNTFVLIGLLGLVIAAGYYLSRTTTPDPADQLREARLLMQEKPGGAWLRARDELIVPLLQQESFPEQKAELQEMVDRADQYEFCRRLRGAMSSDGSKDSEIERLVRRGFYLHADRAHAEATQQLQAVQTIIKGQSRFSYLNQFITDTLTSWNTEADGTRRQAFVHEIVVRAKALAADEATVPQAIALLTSALQLYRDDETVRLQLEQGQELLNTLR